MRFWIPFAWTLAVVLWLPLLAGLVGRWFFVSRTGKAGADDTVVVVNRPLPDDPGYRPVRDEPHVTPVSPGGETAIRRGRST